MRAKLKIAAAAVLLGAVLVSGAVVAASGDAYRPPWENENGIIDESKLPATQEVVDRTGEVVGTVETKDDMAGVYPLPVTGPDGQLVGYISINGFWALGEPEPVIEGAYTVLETVVDDPDGAYRVVEELDAYGERTGDFEIIYD